MLLAVSGSIVTVTKRHAGLAIAAVSTFYQAADGLAVHASAAINDLVNDVGSSHESKLESVNLSNELSSATGLSMFVLAAVVVVVISVVAFLLAVTWRRHIHPSMAVISNYLKSTGSSLMSSLSTSQSTAGRRKAHRRRLRLPGVMSSTFARPVVDRCCGSAPDSAAESPFEDSCSSASGEPWAPRLLEMLTRQQERSRHQQRVARSSKLTSAADIDGKDSKLEGLSAQAGADSEEFFASLSSPSSSGFQTPLELLPTDCEEGSCYGADSPRLVYFSRKLVLLPDD